MISILYKIRNGKAFATETAEFSFEQKKETKKILEAVLDSISDDVRKNVEGKKIYIPDYINYSLPATEKQFTGNFPSGTCVSVPSDMIVGIHWNNVRRNQIDLDLSMISATEKIGWDAYYRTDARDVLFSGDIIDAHNGASELFYVKKQSKKAFVMFVNYYNFNAEIEVPFKILVAKECVRDFKQNYTVNPNNVVAITNSKINQKQKMLGLLVITTEGSKFYFVETNIGRSITSRNSEFAEHSRKYLLGFYENTISLKDVLVSAGAGIVEKRDEADIDLSPETLEKDSILELLV